MKYALFLFNLIAACTGTAVQSQDSTAVFAEYNFPAAPGAIHLCHQNVLGGGGTDGARVEIAWDAFTVSSSPAELVTFYRGRLGEAGFTPKGSGGTWRLPVGGAYPRYILEISSVEADGPYRECKRLPPGTRTILLLSTRDEMP